jgi:hypothetical protein
MFVLSITEGLLIFVGTFTTAMIVMSFARFIQTTYLRNKELGRQVSKLDDFCTNLDGINSHHIDACLSMDGTAHVECFVQPVMKVDSIMLTTKINNMCCTTIVNED